MDGSVLAPVHRLAQAGPRSAKPFRFPTPYRGAAGLLEIPYESRPQGRMGHLRATFRTVPPPLLASISLGPKGIVTEPYLLDSTRKACQ